MKDQPSSFSFKKISILVIILALPGFCYYLLQEKGENRYKSLPFYGEKKLSGTFHSRRGKQIADTLYHEVKPFRTMEATGHEKTFGPDSGVAVVSIFYIENDALANPINAAMAKIAERFRKNKMVQLYSITVNPEDDTLERLRGYKSKWGHFDHWYFLRGADHQEVAKIVREGFLLDVVYDPKDKTSFIHSSQLVLLDSKRRIRGYYDSLINEDTDKLVDEVKLLLTEEFRNLSVK